MLLRRVGLLLRLPGLPLHLCDLHTRGEASPAVGMRVARRPLGESATPRRHQDPERAWETIRAPTSLLLTCPALPEARVARERRPGHAATSKYTSKPTRNPKKQTNTHTHTLTHIQRRINIRTSRQTNRGTDRQTDRRRNKQASKQASKETNNQTHTCTRKNSKSRRRQ
jgi:hypothetical protein